MSEIAPALTLEDARRSGCCRICGESITEVLGPRPADWMEQFGEMIWPVHVVLNFGEEFAHGKCLPDKNGQDLLADQVKGFGG